MKNKKVRKAETIYHYCSLETFMAIIEKKELWCSNILKMNDSSEEKYLEFVLEEYCREIKKELKKDEKYLKQIKLRQKIEEAKSEKERQNAILEYKTTNIGKKTNEKINLLNKIRKKLLVNTILKREILDISRYICCFSENGDILSQWRAYADDGKGLAIGFNVKKIEELLKNLNERENNGLKIAESELTKVIYIKKKKNYFIEADKLCKLIPKHELVDNDKEIEKILESSFLYDENLKIGIHFDSILEFIIGQIWHILCKQNGEEINEKAIERIKNLAKIKNFQFSEEKEYRIITIDKNIKSNFRRSKNNDDLIKYKKIDIKEIINEIIDDIYIGPKNKLTEKTLKEFLENNGIKKQIPIYKSTATYI